MLLTYLKEINRVQLLTADDEKRLARIIRDEAKPAKDRAAAR